MADRPRSRAPRAEYARGQAQQRAGRQRAGGRGSDDRERRGAARWLARASPRPARGTRASPAARRAPAARATRRDAARVAPDLVPDTLQRRLVQLEHQLVGLLLSRAAFSVRADPLRFGMKTLCDGSSPATENAIPWPLGMDRARRDRRARVVKRGRERVASAPAGGVRTRESVAQRHGGRRGRRPGRTEGRARARRRGAHRQRGRCAEMRRASRAGSGCVGGGPLRGTDTWGV